MEKSQRLKDVANGFTEDRTVSRNYVRVHFELDGSNEEFREFLRKHGDRKFYSLRDVLLATGY